MKTVNQVIAELQSLVNQDEEIGNLPVYVIAAHGHQFIQSNCVSLEHVEGDLGYCVDYVIDLEEAEDLSDVKSFVSIGD